MKKLSQTYDPSELYFGWSPKTGLLKGIRETYQWALEKGVFTEPKNTRQKEDLLHLQTQTQTQTLERTAG